MTWLPSRYSDGTTSTRRSTSTPSSEELTEHLAWPDNEDEPRRLARGLARRLQVAPPRGHHHLEAAFRALGRAGPRDP